MMNRVFQEYHRHCAFANAVVHNGTISNNWGGSGDIELHNLPLSLFTPARNKNIIRITMHIFLQ